MDELHIGLLGLTPDVQVIKREGGPFAASEWAIPAAVALFVSASVLNGFLHELGAEGARALKKTLANLFARTKAVPVEIVASDGAKVPSSLPIVSIFLPLAEERRSGVEFIFPDTLDDRAFSKAIEDLRAEFGHAQQSEYMSTGPAEETLGGVSVRYSYGPRLKRYVYLAESAQWVEISRLAHPSPSRSATTGIPDMPIDFAILTAIEVERRAVCAAFRLGDSDRVRKGSRVYWRGRLPLKNGEFYQLVVSQAPDMANVDAALLASDTLHHWMPGAALLVGIAASAHKDVRLGDVVAGSDVYYYERGKVTPEGTKPEPKIIPADATLWSNVCAVPDWDGSVAESRPDGIDDRPKLHYGVIASGEKVIADAAVRDEIASGHRKTMAIEMEGYGFSRAVWQSFERVRHLDIRAICDDASRSKGDGWHKYAAAAAAGFAKHLLLDRPLEPRP
ncbi:hypothetical protein WME97_26575 [Sorangium sp. So ce367]|uniref:5'-methylthioadenosine/S-adenosylhomocysteine nucleosidase family protein n=1 Tax=Sorangium sp. So ce367 TaxID=3133305 RepID=UPI003F61585F